MTTIELPPLPKPHDPHSSPLAFAESMLGETFNAEQMQAYARLAIEQDRARRGEPFGYVMGYEVSNQPHHDLKIFVQRYSPRTYVPEPGDHLYASPQPSIDPAT